MRVYIYAQLNMNIGRENFAWRPGIEGEREMRETELGGSVRKELHTVMSERAIESLKSFNTAFLAIFGDLDLVSIMHVYM